MNEYKKKRLTIEEVINKYCQLYFTYSCPAATAVRWYQAWTVVGFGARGSIILHFSVNFFYVSLLENSPEILHVHVAFNLFKKHSFCFFVFFLMLQSINCYGSSSAFLFGIVSMLYP